MKKAFQTSVVGFVLMFSLFLSSSAFMSEIQDSRAGNAEVMYDPGDPGIG
ncbi:hypothetical protein [Halobacillus kuroshimensis]|nr:hypothetical protein [Halobacillus kuroshimensis]